MLLYKDDERRDYGSSPKAENNQSIPSFLTRGTTFDDRQHAERTSSSYHGSDHLYIYLYVYFPSRIQFAVLLTEVS